MSNYYCYFSFIAVLPEPAINWALHLYDSMETLLEGGTAEDPEMTAIANSLLESMDRRIGFQLDKEEGKPHLWFHDEESGTPSHAAEFLQVVLEKFEIDEPVGFCWSDDCDKPALDTFGGGAMIVTRQGFHWMNTYEWLSKSMATISQETAEQRLVSEYVREGGGFCPQCRSSEIGGGSIDVDDCSAHQTLVCKNCHSSWTDHYHLAGFDEFEPGQTEEAACD